MSGHKDRLKLVREAFDANVLATICMADESYFKKYGTEFKKDGGKGKFAFYCKDDVSDVLGIAHMDSVQKGKDFGVAKYVSGKELVMSPTLDDRLGCYVICELLPKLGIQTDLLLTTDEESGNSTAKHFETTKTYKWMFQFDRAGNDTVMYQYDTPELRKKLEAAEFKTAYGSASDISKLGDLGCSGINFGVGYEDYHFERAYADLRVMFDQVAKFLKFYKTHKNEHLVYDKTAAKVIQTTNYHSYSGGYNGSSYMGGMWSPDDENDRTRRIDGNFYPKMVWDETARLYLPNRWLYKHHPATRLPSWDQMCNANETWNIYDQAWVLGRGKVTEDELFAIILKVLEEVGQTGLKKEPRPPRFSQTSGGSDNAPKSLPETSSNGSLSNESISGGSVDDPCNCGHSRYVHRRTIWRKGGERITDLACDYWKCSCAGFEEISEPRSDILLGG